MSNYYIVQFFLSSIMLIIMPIGMIVASKITKHNSVFEYNYKIDYKISDKMFYIFLGLFVLSITILLLFISKVEMLPIIAIVKGFGTSYAYELRCNIANNFPGKYYRYAMFMKDLPLYLMLILFFLRNISLKWKILFLLIVVFNLFVAIMDIQKAPAMQIFLILFLSSLFYYKQINWKLVIFGGLGLVIVVLLMYAFFMGIGNDFFTIIKTILNRVLFSEIDAFTQHQRYIEANGFLYGKSFPNPHNIFPFEYVQIDVEVYKFVVNWHEGILLGSFPSFFYAQWYDNFGYFGAVFSMFLLGFIVNLVDIKMLFYINKYKSVVIVALYIFLVNFFSQYALTSYIGILTDTHLVFPILISLVLFYINNYFLKKEKLAKSNLSSFK